MRTRQTWGALGVYGLAAVVMFGLPVVDDPTREVISVGTSTDPGLFIWMLEWWPHALTNGLNPLDTDLLWVPDGANLAQSTSVPLLALVLWPVTAAFGPVAAFNVAMLVSPALSAWTAFLLCRRVTRGAFRPSLLAGWLFGWSAYLLGQLVAHPNLTSVYLVPLAVLLVVRRVEGDLGPRAFVALLAATLTGQLLLSTEVLFSLTLFGVLALAAAWFLAPPETRRALAGTAPLVAAAYAVTALVTAPFLYYALKGSGPLVDTARSLKASNDLLAFAFPTEFERLGRRYFGPLSSRYAAGAVEGGAYLGLPLLLVVATFAVTTWWRWTTRLLVVVAALAALLSLGARLQVAGVVTIPLPWNLVDEAPLAGAALPSRFAVYVALAVSVMTALWLVAPTARPVWRWGVALLAVAFLFPNLSGDFWRGAPSTPEFFRSDLHERHLDADDVALVLPVGIGGNSMLWHAEAGLDFRMAGGYVGVDYPASYEDDPLWVTLAYFARVPNMTAHARRFLAEHRVDAVVLDQRLTGPWPGIMAALGVRPQLVGGVLLYRVTPRRRSRTIRTRPAQAIPTSTPRATIASGEPRSSRLPPSAL